MSEPILDLDEFLERVQNDKELLLELLDIFTEDYQNKRKNLKTAVDKKDFEEIVSIAHSLKGASGNISAKKLRQTFLKLEDMGRKNDLANAQESLDILDKQFKELAERIQQVKSELGNS